MKQDIDIQINVANMKDGVKEYLDSCRRKVSGVENIILFGSARTAELVWKFLYKNNMENKIRCVQIMNFFTAVTFRGHLGAKTERKRRENETENFVDFASIELILHCK